MLLMRGSASGIVRRILRGGRVRFDECVSGRCSRLGRDAMGCGFGSIGGGRRYFSASRMNEFFGSKVVRSESEEPLSGEVGQEEGAEVRIDKLKRELEEVNDKIKESNEALEEIMEKIRVSETERDNIQRIVNRDIENAKNFGIKSFVLKLFNFTDTVEICLQNISENQTTLHSGIKSVRECLLDVKNNFLAIMSKYRVKPMETRIGDPFDINKHNAIFEMHPTPELQKPNTIGVIIKDGWMRDDLLLRPAHVGVITKKFGDN